MYDFEAKFTNKPPRDRRASRHFLQCNSSEHPAVHAISGMQASKELGVWQRVDTDTVEVPSLPLAGVELSPSDEPKPVGSLNPSQLETLAAVIRANRERAQ